jgi:hypothetical protein
MAGKRFQGDHGCCRDRADGSCALAMVGRLSEERVRELAEDIWTASIDRVVPARPSPDARPRRGSRSLQRYERFLAEQGVDLSGEQQTKTQDGTPVLLEEPDGRGHVVTAGQDGSPGRTPHGSLPADC